MMRFREFMEIFDGPGSQIKWPEKPKWWQFWKDQPPPETTPGKTLVTKTGDFSVPTEQGEIPYKFYSHIDFVGQNRLLQKTLRRNNMSFEQLPREWKVAQVSFLQVGADGQTTDKITNTGNATGVFKTVMNGIQHIVTTNPIDVILFESSGRDEGRTKLYHRLLNKFVGSLGYSAVPLPGTPHVLMAVKAEHARLLQPQQRPEPAMV